MDNPEKLATFGTQDTGRRQTKLRGNEEWSIQRNWQHWVHKTQDEDKQHWGAIKNGQSRETGKIGHARHRRKTKHRKLKRWATRTPPKPGVNAEVREGYFWIFFNILVISYLDFQRMLRANLGRSIFFSSTLFYHYVLMTDMNSCMDKRSWNGIFKTFWGEVFKSRWNIIAFPTYEILLRGMY